VRLVFKKGLKHRVSNERAWVPGESLKTPAEIITKSDTLKA
jgi:hypothetical protein